MQSALQLMIQSMYILCSRNTCWHNYPLSKMKEKEIYKQNNKVSTTIEIYSESAIQPIQALEWTVRVSSPYPFMTPLPPTPALHTVISTYQCEPLLRPRAIPVISSTHICTYYSQKSISYNHRKTNSAGLNEELCKILMFFTGFLGSFQG